MGSPTASTPSSAGSPAALAPAPPTLAIKSASVSDAAATPPSSGLPTPTTIITRKEWVIPPRPKPGRKPATDTPPTKRKAQNRAAQRAFRERRAARVGELEEQLEETREEQEKREGDLRSKIVRLEAEVLRFNGELHSWRNRCETLDRIADYERREKEAALAELSYLRNGARTTGTDAVPLPPRRARQQGPKAPAAPQYTEPFPVAEAESLGCGNCTATSECACVEEAIAISNTSCGKCGVDTHCECLEETIRTASDLSNATDLKRAHSPPARGYTGKRQRPGEPNTPLEVDFTMQFSSKPVPLRSTQEAQAPIRRPVESCGFCEEGTYCMCAEAAATAAANSTERDHRNRLAPLLNEVTPPPSDTDGDSSAKLPSMHPSRMHRAIDSEPNSCVNGPGTCQQCQSDPKSGLFCRSLAAMRESAAPGADVPEGCCGGNAGGGGCCKSLPTAAPTRAPPSLSVAETYKTLSTHKNFDQASDELNSWVGRLHAASHSEKSPMEVEAASVMGVLKLFDRRFGRE